MNRVLIIVAVPVLGAALLITTMLGVLAIEFARAMNDPFNDAPFDQALWLEHSGDDQRDNPRGMMIDALCDNALKPGMGKSEVMALLGPADYATEQRLSYIIGMWSGFRIDVDTFDLEFDGSGHLQSFGVVQH